jgi:acyl-CoA thioesterase I
MADRVGAMMSAPDAMKHVIAFARGCALAAALALAACHTSSPATSPSPVETTRRVLVLGDSLAVSPSAADNFPANLQARITARALPWRVTNAGVNGDTTADGLRRIDPLLTRDVNVLILELGANDGLRGVDLATIQRNLQTMIDLASTRGARVLLCGMETPPTHGLDYSIAYHFVFPSLAQKNGAALVPFLLDGVFLDPEMTGPDGVHPSAAGAQRIAATVWPYLEPMLTGS